MTVAGDRTSAVLELVGRGRYSPALERAVLAGLARCAAPEGAAVDWRRLFSALVCARRYDAAIRLGELALDRPWRAAASHVLRWPWWLRKAGSVNDPAWCRAEVERLRAERGPWPAYLRAVLWFNLGRGAAIEGEYPLVAAAGAARYGWMRQAFVPLRLESGDFAAARGLCRDVLRCAPWHWWARCRLAQARLLGGDADGAWREFERAAHDAPREDRGDAWTQHAEALLWTGRYREALAKASEAVGAGAPSFALRCRGAARLMLGRRRGALEDLDAAVAADPKDFDAYLWRGEARRRLGRREEALPDYDLFVGFAPDCALGRIARSLALLDCGAQGRAAADLRALAGGTLRRLSGRLGLAPPAGASGQGARRFLEAALRLARGVRSHETYLEALWLGPESA